MKEALYKQLVRIEDHHWWFRSRMQLAESYIHNLSLCAEAKILDVGCGTGGTTRVLQQYGAVTGLDSSKTGLDFARQRADEIVYIEGNANHLLNYFQPSTFDLVTFFNVLYHEWIEDDVRTLGEVSKLLKPGGHVLLTEPAYACLTRKHDVLDMGKTRYRMRDIKKYFDAAGFEYVSGQYFNALSFPVCLVSAFIDKMFSRDPVAQDETAQELEMGSRVFNSLLTKYMAIENRITGSIHYPFGVTLLALGKKNHKKGTD